MRGEVLFSGDRKGAAAEEEDDSTLEETPPTLLVDLVLRFGDEGDLSFLGGEGSARLRREGDPVFGGEGFGGDVSPPFRLAEEATGGGGEDWSGDKEG